MSDVNFGIQKSPLISVLMTAYNREKYIAEAIESVLASSYTNFELIIVDDCSKDNTLEIARIYAKKDKRLKIFANQSNLGDYLNRNKAASYAKGKYIKYLDSDDIMYSHCLDVMVGAMENFPEAGYGLSAVSDIDKPYPTLISPRQAFIEGLGVKGLFDRAPGSSIIKKEAFDRVGGFSGLRQSGDFEFWLKIGAVYPLVKFPVDLYWSRLHEMTESNVNTAKEKAMLRRNVIMKVFAEEKVPLNNEEKKKILLLFNNTGIKKAYSKIKRIINK